MASFSSGLADFGHRLWRALWETYVLNLCSDFNTAERGEIVIPQHFYFLPSTIWGLFPLYNVWRNPPNPPLQPGGPKKTFPKLSKTFILCPITTRQPPGSNWGPPRTRTNQDHLVTSWYHQITHGAPPASYTMPKNWPKQPPFFRAKRPKFKFLTLFSPVP